MRSKRFVALGLLTAVLGACETKTQNPFENVSLTQPPDENDALVFTSNNYSLEAEQPSDLFSMPQDGSAVKRLTACNRDGRLCHTVEAALASDRVRAVARRVVNDSDEDGRLTENDRAGLIMIDLERSIEAPLLDERYGVNSIDWSPVGEQLLFSAIPPGLEAEDLYVVVPGSANEQSVLIFTPEVRERRARYDRSGSFAVFERIEPGDKAQVYLLDGSLTEVPLTFGGPGSEQLEGTPYIVGSDADPCFSPDNSFVVFRRLTGIGNGRGNWDILTVSTADLSISVVVSGPSYRGPPDWGPAGIAFEEPDPRGGSRIAVVQPDGASVSYPVGVLEGYSVAYPRWIPEP
jgi:Tol biopolymer transport system component